MIEEWAEAHHPNTYAGYQLDDRAGGLLRIGFTENQAQVVSEFIEQMHPSAADRITTFTSVPPRALVGLEDLEAQIEEFVVADHALVSKVAGVEIPEAGGSVSVEATNVPAVEAALMGHFGTLNGINLIPVEGLVEPVYSREHKGGAFNAGDRVWNDWTPGGSPFFSWATAGFGAVERKWSEQEKRTLAVPYMVTAGHTGNFTTLMYREQDGIGKPGQYLREHGEKVDKVDRDALTQGTLSVDALAAKLVSNDLIPRYIVGGGPVSPPVVARKHELVCMSGAASEKVACGRIIGFTHGEFEEEEYAGSNIGWIVVKSLHEIVRGDSGGPVWSKADHGSIGLASGLRKGNHHIWLVQPLLTTNYGHGQRLVGALNASVMGSGSLSIVAGG